MVAFNYENARLTATKLITKFGASGSFVVKGNDGGYDDDGNVIASQPDTSISGIVTPLLQYKTNEVDGTTIKTGDSYVFFDGAEVPINAVITLNGDTLRAVSNKELTSVGGVNVYRKIQLRK